MSDTPTELLKSWKTRFYVGKRLYTSWKGAEQDPNCYVQDHNLLRHQINTISSAHVYVLLHKIRILLRIQRCILCGNTMLTCKIWLLTTRCSLSWAHKTTSEKNNIVGAKVTILFPQDPYPMSTAEYLVWDVKFRFELVLWNMEHLEIYYFSPSHPYLVRTRWHRKVKKSYPPQKLEYLMHGSHFTSTGFIFYVHNLISCALDKISSKDSVLKQDITSTRC